MNDPQSSKEDFHSFTKAIGELVHYCGVIESIVFRFIHALSTDGSLLRWTLCKNKDLCRRLELLETQLLGFPDLQAKTSPLFKEIKDVALVRNAVAHNPILPDNRVWVLGSGTGDWADIVGDGPDVIKEREITFPEVQAAARRARECGRALLDLYNTALTRPGVYGVNILDKHAIVEEATQKGLMVQAYQLAESSGGGVTFSVCYPAMYFVKGVEVSVQDISGSIVYQGKSAGHRLVWDMLGPGGVPVESGEYLYTMQANLDGTWVRSSEVKLLIERAPSKRDHQ